MSTIGVDHGTVRSGIAVEIAGIAIPKAIVPTGLILHELWKYVHDYDCKLIVVGKAPHLNGKRSPQQRIQERFMQTLKETFPECTIVFWNEWFSSKQARFELESAGLDSSHHIDDQAAAIILQDYLDNHYPNTHP